MSDAGPSSGWIPCSTFSCDRYSRGYPSSVGHSTVSCRATHVIHVACTTIPAMRIPAKVLMRCAPVALPAHSRDIASHPASPAMSATPEERISRLDTSMAEHRTTSVRVLAGALALVSSAAASSNVVILVKKYGKSEVTPPVDIAKTIGDEAIRRQVAAAQANPSLRF